MDSRDIEVLGSFADVWARVMGSPLVTSQVQEEPLVQRVMTEVHGLYLSYSAMSRGTGAPRCGLQNLAREAKQVFHRLQVAYFLESGEPFHPSQTDIFASCTMSNLRKLWKKASELLQLLQLHSMDARNPFGEELAAAEALANAHKDRLKGLIGVLME